MRCPHCKGSLSAYNFFREKHCPACGELLKRMPTREQVREFLIAFAEDKGYIFWAIVYWFGIWIIAFFEQIFWKGEIFEYIGAHEITTRGHVYVLALPGAVNYKFRIDNYILVVDGVAVTGWYTVHYARL